MNINILKTLMEKENISMYRLSKLSGIENKSIWNIVNNKRKDPQISTVVKIAKALELTDAEFAELCDYQIDKQSCVPLYIRDENLKCYGGNPSNGEWITGACPKCKLDVQLGMNYCPNCGQKLLWENVENEKSWI